jgi:hypothetical protein
MHVRESGAGSIQSRGRARGSTSKTMYADVENTCQICNDCSTLIIYASLITGRPRL